MKIKLSILTTFLFLLAGCSSSLAPDGPTIIFQYSIPQTSDVLLCFENSYDTRLETLANERQAAGSYRYTISGEGLQEGVYFFVLRVNDVIVQRRSVVVIS